MSDEVRSTFTTSRIPMTKFGSVLEADHQVRKLQNILNGLCSRLVKIYAHIVTGSFESEMPLVRY